jgi:two-component system, chemotaxis family, sensor kinase CheA
MRGSVMRSKRIERVLAKFSEDKKFDKTHDELLDKLSNDPDIIKKYPEISKFKNLSLIIDQFENIINSTESKVESIRRDFELATRDLSTSNHKLWEVQSLIDIMLSTVEEGYFIFNKDGICLDFSSKRCSDLLGIIPNNKPLKEVLRIKPESEAHFEKWLKNLRSGPLEFEEIAPLGPDYKGISDRDIEISYLPMKEEDELTAVVVVAKDLSMQKRSQEKERILNEKSQLLMNYQKSRGTYISFFDFVKNGISTFTNIKEVNENKIIQFKRLIHSIKGGAYSLKLELLGDWIHEMEDELLDLFEVQGKEKLPIYIKKINEKINLILEEHEDIFSFRGDKVIEVKRKDLISIAKNLYRINSEVGIDFGKKLLMIDLMSYFEGRQEHIQNLSKKQGKVINILFNGKGKVFLFPKKYERFLFELSHIFNNAVIHGIEIASDRIAKQKDPVGTISISARMHREDLLVLTISDDGSGVDKNQVAVKMNIKEDLLDNKLLKEAIFQDEFSTVDETSKMVGRGIGMGAVKASLEKINGEVEVESIKDEGTTFIFKIPIGNFIEELDDYEGKVSFGG